MSEHNSEHTKGTVHCIGAGGVGVASLARHYMSLGYAVTGCDVRENEVIKKLRAHGMTFLGAHNEAHITDDVVRVIYADVSYSDDAEFARARSRGIPCATFADTLGEITSSYATIAIAGTNGKSTTTALCGVVFEDAGKDPTVVVGSIVPSWQGGYRHGTSDICITEADEYNRHFFSLAPECVVVTNIEAEHLDVYKDAKDVVYAFMEFATRARICVLNYDDEGCQELMRSLTATHTIVTYGAREGADIQLISRTSRAGVQECAIRCKGEVITVNLRIPGLYNVYNAMAAIAAAHAYAVPLQGAADSISSFTGLWRRFETLGEWRGCTLISDYAHHPTAVSGVLLAAQEFFPGKTIVAVFQPHQRFRTHALRHEFVQALSAAGILILMEVYDVAGREGTAIISSNDLLEDIEGPYIKEYAADARRARELLDHMRATGTITIGDVILCMGAGDIDSFARSLLHHTP